MTVHVYARVLATLLCVCVVMGQHTELPNSTTSSASSRSTFSATVPLFSTQSSQNNQQTQSLQSNQERLMTYFSTKSNNLTTKQRSDLNNTELSSAPTSKQPALGHGPGTIPGPGTSPGPSTTSGPGTGTRTGSDTLAVICLVFILIFILILVIILYILWRKGRSYSFDLTNNTNDHDTPLRSMEQGGIFEQQNKELTEVLDYSEESPQKSSESNPVANGCAGETDQTGEETEKASCEHQNVPEEDFFSDVSLTKKVEFNLDLDLIGGESELATSNTDDEPRESQQNENNNNMTNTGNDMDVFTEINLDEPQ